MAEPVFVGMPRRMLRITIDGREVEVLEGSTILDACRRLQIDTPTLCQLDNLTPVNVCRVCVVELEGSRVLVPACSRKVEAGMKIATDSERVRHSRRLVLELLASSVDMSLCSPQVYGWIFQYGANPRRFGSEAATVAQPVKVDNDLYVRDYSRCILCYKCVEACHISTEFDTPLPESACVYCGNCIGVCPTGALMFKSEHDMREAGTWDDSRQEVTETVCPYCGVGCMLELHVQDNSIVKVTSPLDHSVTAGHLCVKGRFGFQFVQRRQG